MQKNKKIKAAIAGVLYYVKTAEERRVHEPLVASSYPVPWSLNGRQMIMQNRTRVQRRVSK